jgi:hypothetical protein
MTIELFLCDECAKRLESIFPEIDWITDNEQGTQEDIEYYLFLNKQLKNIEKCVVCNKNEITTSKYHYFETVAEMENSFIRLLQEL